MLGQGAAVPLSRWSSRRNQVTLRIRRDRSLARVLRETYLRQDFHFGLPAAATQRLQQEQLQHFLVPDAEVLLNYLEVFELAALKGLVLLESVLRAAYVKAGPRKFARVRAMLKDHRRLGSIFHVNDIHSQQVAYVVQTLKQIHQGASKDRKHDEENVQQHVAFVKRAAVSEYDLDASFRSIRSESLTLIGGTLLLQEQQMQLQNDAPFIILEHGDTQELPTLDSGEKELDRHQLQQLKLILRDNVIYYNDSKEEEVFQSKFTEKIFLGSCSSYFTQYWFRHSLDEKVYSLFEAVHQALLQKQNDYLQRQIELKEKLLQENTDIALDVEIDSMSTDCEDQLALKDLSASAVERGILDGRFIQGVFQASKYSKEARVKRSSQSIATLSDIVIQHEDMQGKAIHGDTVAVYVLPADEWILPNNALSQSDQYTSDKHTEEQMEDITSKTQASQEKVPTGRVVGIVYRSNREYVACLEERDEVDLKEAGGSGGMQWMLCVPLDRRIPKVRIRTRQGSELVGMRFTLRIDGWEKDSKYPFGHVIQILGDIGNLKTETKAILIESDIATEPFGPQALADLPPGTKQGWSIPDHEFTYRRDIRRTHRTCSIDPPGCTDVDDALSVCTLENGNIEIGVHIADVSYFVKANSALDMEARSRGTTVYLVENRFDMLPAVLSEDLCSLVSGVDRLAVSVIWEYNPSLTEIVGVWHGRTIIHSTYQLSYQQAQLLLEKGPTEVMHKHVAIKKAAITLPTMSEGALRQLFSDLRTLARVAQQRYKVREEAGALELASAELRFEMSEGRTVGVQEKAELPMMRVVAEMMIAANSAVAYRIHSSFPSAALLRRHDFPRQEALKHAKLCASMQGYALETGSNKTLAASLNSLTSLEPVMRTTVKAMATRAMAEAEYFSTGSGATIHHYGLALEYYTHFTSPIRRYADIIVHRQLLLALGQNQEPLLTHDQLSEVADGINMRNRCSKRAQKDCSELYLLEHLKEHAIILKAVVVEIRPNGLILFLPSFHVRGSIFLIDRGGSVLPPEGEVWSSQEGLALLTSDTDAQIMAKDASVVKQYKLLDTVWIRASASESRAHLPNLQLELLSESTAKQGLKDQLQRQKAGGDVRYDFEQEESMEMPAVDDNTKMDSSRSKTNHSNGEEASKAFGTRNSYSTIEQVLQDSLGTMIVGQKHRSTFMKTSSPLAAIVEDPSALQVEVVPRDILIRRRLYRVISCGSRARALRKVSRWYSVEEHAMGAVLSKVRASTRKRERIEWRAQQRARKLLHTLYA